MMAQSDRPKHWSQLKLLGSWLCLDFVNTVDRQADGYAQEWLTCYADLVAWSQRTQILTELQTATLTQTAMQQPELAIGVFEQAIALRATLYQVFSAVAARRTVQPDHLAKLNLALAEAQPWLQIISLEAGFGWDWADRGDRLDAILWRVVHSAAELLTAHELNRVHECAGEGCGWIFLDLSRNRSRRWCDMEDCGNRSKARRHYARRKQPT